ncbi:MAG: substrate-binding domain-containing protein [Oscillospiraceae bacterium]|jgi:phosphate transport system substrate-binding protein|nr:substrate-binding domain-containing protein [Oscillospiraceae bacterium]
MRLTLKKSLLLLCALALFLTACQGGAETSAPPSAAESPGAAAASPSSGTASTPAAPSPGAAPTATPTPPTPTPPRVPILDGSTANIPMGIETLKRYFGLSEAEAEIQLTFSRTQPSYRALVEGRADLLLVNIADQDTAAFVLASGVALEYYPIRRDALCFIINEINPVKNLTGDQLRRIYQGDITNWKALGGADETIVAFQRNEDSGSQALMRELVMKDLEMAEAPLEFRPGEMGFLVDGLAAYNNAGNALGYTTFYYASVMYQKSGLAFLRVDGVAPSAESVADGTYPFLNEYSAVIRADEPPDSPVRALLAWLLSDEGAAMMEELGYVPVGR